MTLDIHPSSSQLEGTDLSALWEPLDIGSTTVNGRVMDAAKTLLYGKDGMISDRHIAYYRERARGGVALIITEQQGVHPVASGSFPQGCTARDERVIPIYRRLADTVHEFGTKQFAQLYAPGVHDKGALHVDNFHPLWAASAVPSNVHHETPMIMDQRHIDELIEGFAASARNVVASGLDGIEIHGAHSYLIGQFLSPYYNKRTDRYGGSVRERCTFPLEVAQAVRRAVGDDFTVGIRMSFDEFLGEDGTTREQGAEQLEVFAASGLFNYFNISGGAYPSLHMAIPSMTIPPGLFVPFGAEAKRIVGDRGKVFVVGGIRDLGLANQIVVEGAADMVAMSRAHLADPALVRKAKEGRHREVIECVGQNVCAGRLWDQREVICAMNPVTGREEAWGDGTLDIVPATQAKSIVVVGGGIVGMKVASLAAQRGHRVTLMERESELGGHLNLLRRLPTRDRWSIAIDNLRRAMEVAGVEVHLNQEVDVDALNAEGVDTIVVATGSRWDDTGFSAASPGQTSLPGHEQDNVMSVEDATRIALDDHTALGSRVIIAEESSVYLPLGLAEVLVSAGVQVEVISPHLFIGEDVGRVLEDKHLFPRLMKAGVGMVAQHRVVGIRGRDVEVQEIWGGAVEVRSDVDTVVLSMMRRAHRPLGDLEDAVTADVVLAGDAVAPRGIAELMVEAERIGRAL